MMYQLVFTMLSTIGFVARVFVFTYVANFYIVLYIVQFENYKRELQSLNSIYTV